MDNTEETRYSVTPKGKEYLKVEQTWIVEYESGNDTKFTSVTADTYISAVIKFGELKLHHLFPVFEPMGKILSELEIIEIIKQKQQGN